MHTNIKQLIAILEDHANTKGMYTLAQTAPNSVSIAAFNSDIHTAIKAILQQKEINFYTFTPKNLRPKTLILKGMQGGFNEKDVVDEINKHKLSKVTITKITKIIFDKSQQDKFHFLVQITPETKVQKIQQNVNNITKYTQWVEPGISFADKARNLNKPIATHPTSNHHNISASQPPQQTNNNENWSKELKNEMMTMLTALQEAHKLLNEKIENNYLQFQTVLENNIEKIYQKIEANAKTLDEKINSNTNKIDTILSSLMETELA
ncbi:hypothetical protein PV327_011031 [Microctonus hyperodae]|uniref:Uncharacterized protein n=1 Tax=Microctonus hyperodae TaxID=165561 RepID=A0AA39KUL1_MICHY|nr:hypothetical protein PV327_011031 [Microctonus hyperodae]